mmetsp:Transcript_121312/g.387690  ORF Transcript_121312/g.387690 Transcript_121312/m.387690 type:complete len:224 (+) Transcript_121312:1047-1718(+)
MGRALQAVNQHRHAGLELAGVVREQQLEVVGLERLLLASRVNLDVPPPRARVQPLARALQPIQLCCALQAVDANARTRSEARRCRAVAAAGSGGLRKLVAQLHRGLVPQQVFQNDRRRRLGGKAPLSHNKRCLRGAFVTVCAAVLRALLAPTVIPLLLAGLLLLQPVDPLVLREVLIGILNLFPRSPITPLFLSELFLLPLSLLILTLSTVALLAVCDREHGR